MKENDTESNLRKEQFIAIHIKFEKQKNRGNVYIAEIAEINETDFGLRYMTRTENKYLTKKS